MDTKFIIAYWIILGALIYIEHRTLAHRWRAYELARRTLGISTVMLGALPLFLAGLDAATWLVLFVGFGVAGAITGFCYTQRHAAAREAKLLVFRNQIIPRGNNNGAIKSADKQRRTAPH